MNQTEKKEAEKIELNDNELSQITGGGNNKEDERKDGHPLAPKRK
ncbi:MAG: bacteriocin [Alphaproteobacteria bacterium]|nr:bacteriocin [Alphaproteobacteria bacterium]